MIIDPNATELADRFKAIGIIDSDNDAVPSEAMGKGSDTYGYGPSVEVKNADKEARPNTVTFYALQLIEDIEGTPCWQLVGLSMDAEGYAADNPCILYKLTAFPLYDEQLIARYSESTYGGGTVSVIEHVDLVVETAFTTDESEPVENLYGYIPREHTVTEFVQGDPITLNFLVQNRSKVILNEAYAGKAWFTADWKVIRESDGVVVSQGQSICNLPQYWSTQIDYVTMLNSDGDGFATWKPGAYTAVLEVNADRSIVEAYYLNNLPVKVRFVVTPSDDWEPEDDQEEEPEDEPVTPDQPFEPDQPSEPDKPAPGKSEEPMRTASITMKSTGRALPQTGDLNMLWMNAEAIMTVTAMALFVAAFYLRASIDE